MTKEEKGRCWCGADLFGDGICPEKHTYPEPKHIPTMEEIREEVRKYPTTVAAWIDTDILLRELLHRMSKEDLKRVKKDDETTERETTRDNQQLE